MNEPTGVLLMAYGTPDTLDNVEPYYTHIRHGRPPSPDLLAELRGRYQAVGGTTPLLRITEETRDELQHQLGDDYRVFLGMKHWHPYIEQGVREMTEAGVTRAVGLILAPHYSRMSVAQYYDYVQKAQRKLDTAIEILPIESWHLQPGYLQTEARRIEGAMSLLGAADDVTVIFSAHSLPARIVGEGDPYRDQLMETSRVLAGMLQLPHWTFAFQSAGRTEEEWLGPDLLDVMEREARNGARKILVAPIGFVSHHLEILYDIDVEAQQRARELGVSLERIDMPDASRDFVAALADLVRARAGEAAVLS